MREGASCTTVHVRDGLGILNVRGFSEAAFRGVPIFRANHHGRFVAEVEAVELRGTLPNLL